MQLLEDGSKVTLVKDPVVNGCVNLKLNDKTIGLVAFENGCVTLEVLDCLDRRVGRFNLDTGKPY